MRSKLSKNLRCAYKCTFPICPPSRCDETLKTERENFLLQQHFDSKTLIFPKRQTHARDIQQDKQKGLLRTKLRVIIKLYEDSSDDAVTSIKGKAWPEFRLQQQTAQYWLVVQWKSDRQHSLFSFISHNIRKFQCIVYGPHTMTILAVVFQHLSVN